MKLNIIFILNTIVAGVYGIAFVLAPAQVNALYGTATTDAQLAFMCQLFGAGFIGWAVLTWLARNATASDTRDAIVFALFVGSTIGFIVATMGALGGYMNQLSWLTVGLYLFFSVAFGYFKFFSKA